MTTLERILAIAGLVFVCAAVFALLFVRSKTALLMCIGLLVFGAGLVFAVSLLPVGGA